MYAVSLKWVAAFCAGQRSKGMVCQRISHPCRSGTVRLWRMPLRVQNTAKTLWSVSQDNASMCFVDVRQLDSY